MSQKQTQKQENSQPTEVEETEAVDLSNEGLDQATEDILADIDDILESDAQAFVEGFVQRGGQ